MLSWFKKKSKLEILEEKYRKLMEDGYKASTNSRAESDRIYAEAVEVQKEIEALLELEKKK